MDTFPDNILATFPRIHRGDLEIQGCWKRWPCFGTGIPSLRCRKKLDSAPKTWTVPDGNRANLSRPCAVVDILAANNGPISADVDGRCFVAISLIADSTDCNRASTSTTPLAHCESADHSDSLIPDGLATVSNSDAAPSNVSALASAILSLIHL